MPQEPVKKFTEGGDIYEIPESKVSDFLKDLPDAQPIDEGTPAKPVAESEPQQPQQPQVQQPVQKPQTLQAATDKDNQQLEQYLKKALAPSQEGVIVHAPDANIKKPEPVPEKGLSKIIDDAGTIIESIPQSIAHGAIKAVEGVPSAIANLGGNAMFTPGAGVYGVIPTSKEKRQENAANTAEIQQQLDKGASAVEGAVNPEYENTQKQIQKMAPAARFIGNTVSGMASFLPAMAAAPATGGASLFFSGYQNGLDDTKDQKIDPAVRQSYAMLSGGIFAALNAIPIGRALNKTLADRIVSKLALKSLSDEVEANGGKLTYDVMNEALNKAKATLADKVKTAGVKGLKNLAEGSAFTAANQLSDLGIKAGLNEITGKPTFKLETPKEFAEHLISGTAALGIMQGAMGGFSGHAEGYIKDRVAEAKTPADLNDLHNQIENMADAGKISDENATELHNAINSYAEIKKTLPETLNPEQQSKIFDLIKDRNTITAANDQTQHDIDELNALKQRSVPNQDEALQPTSAQHIDDRINELSQNMKINQAAMENHNDKIREIATGKQYEYKKDKGEYLKKLGDGEWEPAAPDPEVAAHLFELNKTNEKAAKEETPTVTVTNPINEGEPVNVPVAGNEPEKEVKPAEAPANENNAEVPESKGETLTQLEKISFGDRTDKQHADFIKQKLAKTFTDKGVPKEQVDAALSLLDARAKIKNPDNPDAYYRKIEDVKNGEFESGNKNVLYQVIDGIDLFNGVSLKEAKPFIDEAFSHVDNKDEAKTVYRKLSAKYHPDRNNSEEATSIMQYINEKKDDYDNGRISKQDKEPFAQYRKKQSVNVTPEQEAEYKKNRSFGDKVNEVIVRAFANKDELRRNYEKVKADIEREYEAARTNAMNDWKVGVNRMRFMAKPEPHMGEKLDRIRDEALAAAEKERNADLTDLEIQFKRKSKPLFQDEKGALETLENGRKVIHALEAPDISTVVHEMAHLFEDELTDDEKTVIQKWAGTDKWTPETSEAFARGFERYLRDGKAPTPEMKPIFQKFKDWLKTIYTKLSGSAIAKNITPEVKGVFDNLFKKGGEDAVQEQSTDEGLLRNEGVSGKGELPGVGAENEKPVQPAKEGTPEKEPVELGAATMTRKQGPKVSRPVRTTDEHYAEVAGSKPVKKSNGIASEPITGEQPKRLSDIAKDLVDGLNMKIRKITPEHKGAGAAYRPGDAGVITRLSRNLKYIAHETGHFLDDKFGLLTNILKSGDKPLMNELREFSEMEMASQPPEGVSKAQAFKYHMQEGFAEWLRNYIAAPEETAKRAPNIYKLYQSLPNEVKGVIDQFSTDYRTFEGATAFDRTMASVKMEPDKAEGVLGKLFKKKKDNPGFKINWVDNLAANWVDPLQAFNKAAKYLRGIRGLDEVLPENDPYLLARLYLSVDRKFGEMLDKGIRDGKGEFYLNKDGEKITLNSLLKHFDNTDEATIKREMAMAVHYMISQRVLELKDRFNREDLISGVGGGVVTDLKNAEQGIKEFGELPEETQDRLKKAVDAYRDMADATLKYMVDMGRLSKDQYKTIKENNLYYVAFNRIRNIGPDEEIAIFKNTGGGGKIGVVKEPIKKIKGGESEMQNPYLSLMDNYHRALKEADRNKIMLAFRDLMITHRGMHKGEPIPISNIGTLGKSPNSIPIFVDGKAEHWTFTPDLYKSIKGINEVGGNLGWPLETLAKLPAALRASIVYFPAFQLRNITRDTFDSFVKSTTGKSFKHFFKGTKQDWDEIAAMGGLNAGYYAHSPEAYYAHMNEAIRKISKDKKFILANGDKLKMAWKKYEHFMEKGETLNRVAEYRSAFTHAKDKLGYDDYNAMLYAAFHARDLMDFAVMGYQMRVVNKFVPFSNAAIQGVRSGVKSAIDHPGKFAVRMAVNTVLPQVAIWLYNHRDKESAKRYEEMPAYQRDLFWNIPVAGHMLTIPKPYELGMPAAGIDRGLSKIFGYNKNAYEDYAGQVVEAMSPIGDMSAMAGPLAPFVEAAFNYDAFRDKHIVPEYEENLPLHKRKNEYASRIGLAIQKIAPIDARYTDFLLRNTLGYYGTEALKVSNIGRKESSNKPNINDIGFFKDYPAYNAVDVQKLVDYASENGKTSTKEYKKFRAMTTLYFTAKTTEQRNQLAKEMIDYSKELLNEWETEHPKSKKKSTHSYHVTHP